MKRIGLLGGSFNPAHIGHRRISLFALRALGLDEVWWMVSPGNPLKPRTGMATLSQRFHSASQMARRAPIRVSAIEQELGTRYTVDSLREIRRRYRRNQFIWLMGADNLAQFHLWREWQAIAGLMPIAVIARPGYDDDAIASPAMAWLRRYRIDAARIRSQGMTQGKWSTPALTILRFDPDPHSATAIRGNNPDWAAQMPDFTPRDQVTYGVIDA